MENIGEARRQASVCNGQRASVMVREQVCVVVREGQPLPGATGGVKIETLTRQLRVVCWLCQLSYFTGSCLALEQFTFN